MAAQSTDASRRFYTLSAVYAPAAVIPLLTGATPLSSVLLYALCLLHVQVRPHDTKRPADIESLLYESSDSCCRLS